MYIDPHNIYAAYNMHISYAINTYGHIQTGTSSYNLVRAL